MIEGRLRSGIWELRHAGVHAVAGAPATWEQAVLAACLAGGRGTVASHGTALRLWDLTDKVHADAVHVLSTPSRRIRREGVTSHRTLLLPEVDVARRLGIPTATVARSIVEVSGGLGVDATGRLLDLASRRRRGELEAVRACTPGGVRSAFDADRARANELVILGWRVVRFTSATPAEVLVDQVRRLLGAVAA